VHVAASFSADIPKALRLALIRSTTSIVWARVSAIAASISYVVDVRFMSISVSWWASLCNSEAGSTELKAFQPSILVHFCQTLRYTNVMAEPSVLDRVAATYEDAVQRGIPPIKAVMDGLGLSRGTAIRRIRSARDSGTLPEDSRPTYNSKLVAVANALSVKPEELRKAILTHAGGDLRVESRSAHG
jgi:Family of unknown function (DUF6214)